MKTVTKLGALLLGLYSFSSQADTLHVNGYYQGIGIGSTQIDVYESDSIQFTTLYGRFGYQFSRYFALEGRIGFGLNDESTPLNGLVYTQNPQDGSLSSEPIKSEIDSSLDLQTSIFVKANYPISSRADVFLFGGYGRNKLSYNEGDLRNLAESIIDIDSQVNTSLITEQNYDEGGVTYGTGIDYRLSQRWQISAEYQYFDTDEGDIYALNLSVNYRF
ncbi:porin family protein [Pseudoalteromonas sp. FUC4]|uniref:porin family protein n=1 Tax=Pseudoalteromonas sp. FUC4 TaxID=2511201 RepID=UPI0011F0A27D|nr:porin family protein [Pseudoalteromonas sp. FUC4]KAA1151213.1 porin family protein [Pseudoalteromonas sp. FUC4]